ncbi:MAG: hypothetical protein JSS86_19030 [Cyanobacteria bacterium SZAS LIN-2]|nr:hypothetical protein [Cyanobacteria bacterium SZAS LIN-2]
MKLLAALLIGGASAASAQAAKAEGSIHLDTIQVRLYLNSNGTLSEPLTGKEGLWNVIIGGGDIGTPSNEMLVDVSLRGTDVRFAKNRKVTLRVSDAKSGKSIARFSSQIGAIGQSGQYHVPFLIRGTGCEELLLSASLSGSPEHIERRIPFACGE